MTTAALAATATHLLPNVTPLNIRTTTRNELIDRKRLSRVIRHDVAHEAKDKTVSHEERNRLFNAVRTMCADEELLEQRLKLEFIPQHGPEQLIGPRLLFRSPLFRVASRTVPRLQEIKLELGEDENCQSISYIGPELRQTEALIFMSILQLLRDYPVTTAATFSPKELSTALFGHYDGRSRIRIRECIRSLLRGQIKTRDYTVQLCHRFEHPQHGPWTVAIDNEIVRLFSRSTVWLKLSTRLKLPEGLATWLYCYVESQTRLIPTKVEQLRKLCGADADHRAFINSLRKALQHLNAHAVIDSGYKLTTHELRWRKASSELEHR